jgi:hypothetical protein
VGESTGRISFINTSDYVSDVTGTAAIGCMATLSSDGGADVVVYTDSLRLQQTLEMAYATKTKVAADYAELETINKEQQQLVNAAEDRQPSLDFSGPFRLRALWTLE